jgi:uncharacterized Fe-S center protein
MQTAKQIIINRLVLIFLNIQRRGIDLIINPRNNQKAVVSYDNPNDAQSILVMNNFLYNGHQQSNPENLYDTAKCNA